MRGNFVVRAPARRYALFTTAAIAAFANATGAFAQDSAASSADDEIVVTGSFIPRPGFISNSPVSTITAEEMQLQHPVDVEAVVRGLPQFLSGNSSALNNGSSGTSTIDLRGLSTPRTLVLIDGKRVVGFDPNGVVDVTAIPVAMLERVDIVTGGASAVYGSDAMAGVVNFIIRDDFTGARFDANYSVTDHQDGERESYGVTLGADLDNGRGNVALHVGYLTQEQVNQSERPIGEFALDSDSGQPGGSSNSIPTVIDSTSAQIQVDSSDPTGFSTNIIPFNFNPQNLYQGPQERWTALAVANYDINAWIEAYGRFLFSSSVTAPSLASTATFGFSFDVPVNNPFLSAAQSNFLAADNGTTACPDDATQQCVNVGIRRRMLELGPRQYNYDYDTFQTLVGLRGDLPGALSNWRWDVTYAHGENQLQRQQKNDIDATRIQQALYATNATTCQDPSNGCAPINFFDVNTPISAQALAFIRLDLSLESTTTQDFFTTNFNGDIGGVRSPLAETPINVAFGTVWRRETSDFRPDAASASGVSPGYGQTLPISGDYDVWEGFIEGLAPVIENAPFADFVNLELGYRISDYSTSGNVESYKYGAEWQPVGGLRFRGMFQRAVRAANIAELFTPLTPGTGNLTTDPCAQTVITSGPLLALCQGTGAPLARLNAGTVPAPISGQINNFVGGSQTLDPETADTVTLGFVFQPDFIDGLSMTLDYYDIQIDDAIAIRPASDIISACYSPTRNPTADPNSADCRLVLRNTQNGSLSGDLQFGVVQSFQNIAQVNTSGIDLGFNYELDLARFGAPGVVTIAFDGTHVMETSYRPSPTSASISCEGRYGQSCGLPSTATGSVGGPDPEYRWVQRTTWTVGGLDLSYRWRHLSGVTLDDQTGNIIPAYSSIDDYDYVDLSAVWRINDTFRFSAAVTNIFDKDPPVIGNDTGSTTFNSGNTYPATYDVLGRVISVGVSAQF